MHEFEQGDFLEVMESKAINTVSLLNLSKAITGMTR